MVNRTFILVCSRLSLILAATLVGGLLSCGGGGSSDGPTDFAPPESLPSIAEPQSVGSARLLFSDDFEGGQASPSWTLVEFAEINYRDVPRFVQVGGRWAAHYRLLGGSDPGNEQQPLHLVKSDFSDWVGSSELEELYIEHLEYWDENYDSATGSQKMVRIGRYVPDDPFGPYLDSWNQEANTNLQIFHYYRDGGSASTNEYFQNTNRGLEKGRWVKFGNWVKLNSPGRADGFARLYVDDQLIASIEQAEFRPDSRGYNFFFIGGNATYFSSEVSNRESYPVRDCSRFISGIRVYTTKPNS